MALGTGALVRLFGPAVLSSGLSVLFGLMFSIWLWCWCRFCVCVCVCVNLRPIYPAAEKATRACSDGGVNNAIIAG